MGHRRLRYRHLDAAQLIKHYLGLRKQFQGQQITLLYIFWEPTNPKANMAFARHRDDVRLFSNAVEGGEVAFQASSYPELWRTWKREAREPWVAEHVAQLRRRYAVPLK